MDDPDSLRQTLVRKHIKYHNLLGQLRTTLPDYSVEQFTFGIEAAGEKPVDVANLLM